MNEKNSNPPRFISLKRERGIRKDQLTGNYVASKLSKGKRISKSFSSLNEAKEWQQCIESSRTGETRLSVNKSISFERAWKRYILEFVSTLATSSQESLHSRAKLFEGLNNYEMNQINPHVIADLLLFHKEQSINLGSNKRCNFNHELKLLKAFFNWYRETLDYTFVNPILKRHRQMAKVKETSFKDKKMTPDEMLLFLNSIKEDKFWYQFAITQFYFAGRVQEIAGLQKSSVLLADRQAIIKDVSVWGKDKSFLELKSLPKNGEIRTVFLNDSVLEVMKERLSIPDDRCSFLFHIKGQPLKYREIQYNYNKALKRCGLYPRFSGTHFMRHSMATITRKVTKSLELTQSITGHRDQKLVQHYAYMDTDNNRLAQNHVESFLINLQNEGVVVQM